MTNDRYACLLPYNRWRGSEIQEGIDAYSAQQGKLGEFDEFEISEVGLRHFAAQRCVRGVITFSVDPELLSLLSTRRIKSIHVSAASDEVSLPAVVNDEWQVGYSGAQSLVKSGATRLVYYCEISPGPGYRNRRLLGAKAACQKAGIPFEHWKSGFDSLDLAEEESHREQAVARFMQQTKPPLAVLASGPAPATIVSRAVDQLNWQLGREVALLHLSDHREFRGQVVQGISSVGLDWREVGFRAAEALCDWVERGKRPPQLQKIDPLPPRLTPSSDASYGRSLVTRACTMIRHSSDYGLTAQEIAELLEVNPSTLHRNWRKAFKHSLNDELVARKIEHSKQLLATTDWALTEISAQCGYSSHYHFVSAFRKMVGKSPGHWRKEQGSD